MAIAVGMRSRRLRRSSPTSTSTPAPTLSDYRRRSRPLSDDTRVANATSRTGSADTTRSLADTGDQAADAECLLTAANAAFREARARACDGPCGGTATRWRLERVCLGAQSVAAHISKPPTTTNSLRAIAIRWRARKARASRSPTRSGNGNGRRSSGRADDPRSTWRAAARGQDGGAADARADGIRRSRSAARSHARRQTRAQGVNTRRFRGAAIPLAPRRARAVAAGVAVAILAPPRRASTSAHSPLAADSRAVCRRRRPLVVAIPHPRARLTGDRGRAAARRHHANQPRRSRHRRAAGRVGVDARRGRRGQSLATIDDVSAPARRFVELERRSHGARPCLRTSPRRRSA